MAKVKAVYVTGKTVNFQLQNIETEEWLLATSGSQEAYNAANELNYNIAATEIGTKGIYEATVPTITVLPGRFIALAIDEVSGRIVGIDEIVLDLNGNIIDVEDTMFAGIAGKNSGVGTSEETYRGMNGTARFKTTFVNGNRNAVEYGESID